MREHMTIDDIKIYAVENGFHGFTVYARPVTGGTLDEVRFKKCDKAPENADLELAMWPNSFKDTYLYGAHPCDETNMEDFAQICEQDPYLCLRVYRQDSDLQSSLDQREFAQLFEKYRTDKNNFSLF